MVGEIDDTHTLRLRIVPSESSDDIFLVKFRFNEFDRNCLAFENPIICSNCNEGYSSYGGTCYSDECNNDIEKLKGSVVSSKVVDDGESLTLRIKRANIRI